MKKSEILYIVEFYKKCGNSRKIDVVNKRRMIQIEYIVYISAIAKGNRRENLIKDIGISG